MKDSVFADSNIFLYLLDQDLKKKQIALKILQNIPIISTQVIGENISVCLKKLKQLSLQEVLQHAEYLLSTCKVKPVTSNTLALAIIVCQRYKLSYWDSQIVASALENNCTKLFSEDMQHNQIIENKLTIINPFL